MASGIFVVDMFVLIFTVVVVAFVVAMLVVVAAANDMVFVEHKRKFVGTICGNTNTRIVQLLE